MLLWAVRVAMCCYGQLGLPCVAMGSLGCHVLLWAVRAATSALSDKINRPALPVCNGIFYLVSRNFFFFFRDQTIKNRANQDKPGQVATLSAVVASLAVASGLMVSGLMVSGCYTPIR